MKLTQRQLTAAAVVFFLGFTGLVYFIKHDQGQSVAPRALDMREAMSKHPGVRSFNQGAYERIKGMSEDKACDLADSSHRLMCFEGYYYVGGSLAMNEFFKQPENSGTLEVRVRGISEALGTGIALSFLRKSPMDIKITGPEYLLKYVYDGWGQRESMSRAFENVEGICNFPADHNRYCLFGAGRGLFFMDVPFDSLQDMSQPMKMGFRFARIFGGEQAPLGQGEIVETLAQSLKKSKESEWTEVIRCEGKKPEHIADCQI